VEFKDSNGFDFYNDLGIYSDLSMEDGNISMNDNRILGLPEPTSSGEPLTQGSGSGDYVDRTGDTMSGDLDLQDNFLLGNNGEIDFSSGEMILNQQMPNSGSPTTLQINQDGTPKWALVSMQDGGLGIYDAEANEIVQEFNENGVTELKNRDTKISYGNLGIGTNNINAGMQIGGVEVPSMIFNDSEGKVQTWEIGEGIISNSGEFGINEIDTENTGSDIVFNTSGSVNVPSGDLDIGGNDLTSTDYILADGNKVNYADDIDLGGNNLRLEGGYLSGDGDDEGILVDNSGQVGVGVSNPQSMLDVSGGIKVPAVGTNTTSRSDYGDKISFGSGTSHDNFAMFQQNSDNQYCTTSWGCQVMALTDSGGTVNSNLIVGSKNEDRDFQPIIEFVGSNQQVDISETLTVGNSLNVQNGQFQVQNDGQAVYNVAGTTWGWKVDNNGRVIWDIRDSSGNDIWSLAARGPGNELVIEDGSNNEELVAIDDQGNVDLRGGNLTSVDQVEGHMERRGRVCPQDHYLYQGYCAEKDLHYTPKDSCSTGELTRGVCEQMFSYGNVYEAWDTCDTNGGRLPTPAELDRVDGTGKGWDGASVWVQVAEDSSDINSRNVGIGAATRYSRQLNAAPLDQDKSGGNDDIAAVEYKDTQERVRDEFASNTGGELNGIHCVYD
jgi:hypothetical protein